jgi:hypothetical protein
MTTFERLDRLERDLRRWKLACLCLVAAVGAVGGLGAAVLNDDAPFRTSRLEVVDDNGHPRAWLATADDDVEFVLTAPDGREAMRLEVPHAVRRPSLYLYDRAEGHMAELTLTQTGPVLHFSDRQRVRLRLATNELNAPLVEVVDAEGKQLFAVTHDGPNR